MKRSYLFVFIITSTIFVSQWGFGSYQESLKQAEQIETNFKPLKVVEWSIPQALKVSDHKQIEKMYLDSFLDAYKVLSKEQLKISNPTKEKWLEDTFKKEIEALKDPSSSIKLITVKERNVIVGAATLEEVKIGNSSAFYVRQLALLPEYRRKGLGSEIMQLIEKEARDQNLSSVVLMVRVLNNPGRKFYSKLGYEEGIYHHPDYSKENYIGYLKKIS